MSIHQEVLLPSSPADVYRALATSEGHTAFSGAPAEIGEKAGDVWSAFGGAISGRNLELVADKRIVQAWRAGNWPEGVYSVVRFELYPDGDGTRLTLDHTGYPDGQGDHLSSGWEANYWGPLKTHLTT